jgi:hypothetical protein
MFFGLTQEIATVIESIVVRLMVVEQQLYLLEYQIQVCHSMFERNQNNNNYTDRICGLYHHSVLKHVHPRLKS